MDDTRTQISKYIMSEDMYNSLCSVHGFKGMNGNSYQEHIILIVGEQIPDHLHSNIINSTTGNDALQILKDNNICYTHTYSESENPYD